MSNDQSSTPETPRQLAGFYFARQPGPPAQAAHQESLAAVNPRDDAIPGRLYQTRFPQRPGQARFSARDIAAALLVLATGTGKTRVADVAISEALLRAGWVRRILLAIRN